MSAPSWPCNLMVSPELGHVRSNEDIVFTLCRKQLAVRDGPGVILLVWQEDIDRFMIRMSQARTNGVGFFGLPGSDCSHIHANAYCPNFLFRRLRAKSANEELD